MIGIFPEWGLAEKSKFWKNYQNLLSQTDGFMSKKGSGDFGKETVGFSKNHRGTGRDQTEILGSRGIQEELSCKR